MCLCGFQRLRRMHLSGRLQRCSNGRNRLRSAGAVRRGRGVRRGGRRSGRRLRDTRNLLLSFHASCQPLLAQETRVFSLLGLLQCVVDVPLQTMSVVTSVRFDATAYAVEYVTAWLRSCARWAWLVLHQIRHRNRSRRRAAWLMWLYYLYTDNNNIIM